MSKPVILTGLRANNNLQIGNYLGALQPIIDLQRAYAGESQINLFIPDLHSFTTPIDHSILQSQILENLKMFVAAGLDLNNDDTYIYRQSYIPAHSELTVILNNFTYMGELSRMTQYKDKGDAQQNVSVGLFDYPVLMAADILLYQATHVPVGEDQTQHVELARDIAARVNNKFNAEIFTLPKAFGSYSQTNLSSVKAFNKSDRLRVRDLQSPEKKMSKSDDSGKGVIFLSDTPESAHKKIMGATTDNFGEVGDFDMKKQPGISNLMQIYATLSSSRMTVAEAVAKFKGQRQYGAVKSEVADVVANFLVDLQAKLAAVDEANLVAKLEKDEMAMNIVANETLFKVQKAVGLRR